MNMLSSYIQSINPIVLIVTLISIDTLFSVFIVNKVSYTEIDWVAYMQEVEGYLSGERNYSLLKGDTGPLVYPAGFVYIFVVLRYLTNDGLNIRVGQYIFVLIYIVVLSIVLFLYKAGDKVPSYVWPFLLLSKRVHSIFMLRMFNDCVAVLFGYLSLYMFINDKWRLGSFVYSLAVSVKMNMLLWAPGILLLLIMGTGILGTIQCLSICAALQLVLGFPFLSTYPVEYISNSFNLGRSFLYEWTVNFKFLSEDVFVRKELSILLLILTVIVYYLFGRKFVNENFKSICLERGKSMKILGENGYGILIGVGKLSPNFIVLVVFISNFIGVVFVRTIHYQFYCWYFHMIPYLLWHCHIIPLIAKLLIWVGIEYAYMIFPATPNTSLILQAAHLTLLLSVYFTPAPMALETNKKKHI